MSKTLTVGLIAAPELGEEIAHGLVKTLPSVLKSHISKETEWEIEIVVDPLTGAADTVEEIFQKAVSYKNENSWNYIVCLTDLPIFHDKNTVAIDINESIGISLISIAAFGFRPILKRIKNSVVYTFKEMHEASKSIDEHSKNREKQQNKIFFSEIIKHDFPISPIQKIRLWMEETGDLHTRLLVVPRLNGSIRLLSGMTFANNPLKMMSSLTNVIAIAFTTGAFGMIFTTMWKLSHLFSSFRLTVVMFAAILGMVLWIINAHELWEPLSLSKNKRISKLYNTTTVLTLLISISVYYVIILLLFLSTTLILLPPDFLGKTLELNKSAGFMSYVRIAWFAASISTVAGAIGVGLENDELVRDSTYGYRQKRRYREIQQEKEEEETSLS